MSSLWTPDGERPISRTPPPSAAVPEDDAETLSRQPTADEMEQIQEELAEMQAELSAVPAAAIVANHAVGLFQLAAVHLQAAPPNLADARLAVDAMAAIVDGCRGRLGPDESTLVDALSQIRLAFVQVSGALGG